MRGQGWRVGGQINILPLGLIRLRNFVPAREAGEEGVSASSRDFLAGSGVWGHRCGYLRLEIRRPEFTRPSSPWQHSPPLAERRTVHGLTGGHDGGQTEDSRVRLWDKSMFGLLS